MHMSDSSTTAYFLTLPIEHIDITKLDGRGIIDAYRGIRGVAGDLADASDIYTRMLKDKDCTIFLTLAGSSSAQGLMDVWPAMVRHRMVDSVLATGASVIDMDLYEALGFRHYHGHPGMDNEALGNASVDRIFDTLISEDNLLEVDGFCRDFLETLEERAYSPREMLWRLGKYLSENPSRIKKQGGLVQACFEEGVPLFSLGLTDSAFGMGMLAYQVDRDLQERAYATLDTTPEYTDVAKMKLLSPTTGLFMIGGGIPKNHEQDSVIAAQALLTRLRARDANMILTRLGYGAEEQDDEVPLHRYALQITVADPRDGACSSSTLEEARSWGKVDLAQQKMVFAEATSVVPLIASHLYQTGSWKSRLQRRYADWFATVKGPADFGSASELERIMSATKITAVA